MSLPGVPLPPNDRFTLRRESDGWTIRLARTGTISRAFSVTVVVFAGVGGLILGGVVAIGALARLDNAIIDHCPGVACISLIALVWGLYRISHDFIFATIHATNGSLLVEIIRLGWKRQFTWETGDIQAIGAWDGLHIVAMSRSARFFADWDLQGMDWVAQALRAILLVPEHLAPGENEIMVNYTGNYWDRPMAGVLCVARKELALRHPLVTEPHLIFRPDDSPRARGHEPVIPLAPSDIACRIFQDRRAELTIAPDGVVCRIQGGVPYIKVPVFGPLLHHNILLKPGCSFGCETGTSYRELRLTFSCDDGEAIQQALACFWGADEKDQPR